MKFCHGCQTEKDESAFNRRGDGWQTRCRACSKQWYQDNKASHYVNVKQNTARYIARNMAYVNAIKAERGCAECDEKDPAGLDFDHLRDKVMDISRAVQCGWSIAKLDGEIAKCEVVCTKHHRKRTKARRAT